MNIQDILLIYDYNYWANKRILTSAKKVTQEQFLAPAEFPYGGPRGTLVHILETEWAWRVRYEGHADETGELLETEFPSLAAVEARWKEEESAMRAYLAGLRDEDLEKGITYPIEAGKTRTRILWHCLVHVVNHGTQHRSEAAALLTRYGQSPGDLDFTVFLNSLQNS